MFRIKFRTEVKSTPLHCPSHEPPWFFHGLGVSVAARNHLWYSLCRTFLYFAPSYPHPVFQRCQRERVIRFRGRPISELLMFGSASFVLRFACTKPASAAIFFGTIATVRLFKSLRDHPCQRNLCNFTISRWSKCLLTLRKRYLRSAPLTPAKIRVNFALVLRKYCHNNHCLSNFRRARDGICVYHVIRLGMTMVLRLRLTCDSVHKFAHC